MAEKKQIKISKIVVDRPACIGAASCIAIAPETFELDDEAKVIVKNQHGNSDEDILEGAKSCPTDALSIFDEEGNKIWPAGQ